MVEEVLKQLGVAEGRDTRYERNIPISADPTAGQYQWS